MEIFMPSVKLSHHIKCFLLVLIFACSNSLEIHAKPGSSGSMGSRGTRTFSAPAPTQTAPKIAAPIERSATPTPQSSAPSVAPQAATPAPQAKSRFGMGLLAGFLGASLFSGLFGSMFSFLLPVLLIAGLGFLALRFFQNRSQPVMARANVQPRQTNNPTMGNAAPNKMPPRPEINRPVPITPSDFAYFEKMLGDIQAYYSAEDMNGLRTISTSEMASYFEADLADNARKGQVNRISDVKLLQGDLSESWGEPNIDFATVAMRFSLNDIMLDRVSGALISSQKNGVQEATELWTFMRPVAGSWKLSAIQQAG